MNEKARRRREVARLVSVGSLLCLLLLGTMSQARADIPLNREVNISLVDPYGQGTGTFTVFYGVPQTTQVDENLTIPVKMSVNSFTGLMNFLDSYNITLLFSLSNGKSLSGTVGVSGNEAAENLGALQLRSGQAWGPVNITLPLTPANTGLGQGQEALANITLRVDAQIYLNPPVNFYRPEDNQTNIGYMLVQNGVPPGASPNYVGFGVLGLGIIVVGVAIVMRPKKTPTSTTSDKAPGAV